MSQITSANNLTLRDYIKTTTKISCKNYNNSQINTDKDIIWVLTFGAYFELQSLKRGQKAWYYWLKNKIKIVLKEPK